MTLLPVSRGRLGTAPSSHALRALPVTALTLDLALIMLVGGLAAAGRERIPLFGRSAEIVSTLGLAGPGILCCWVLAIAVAGGYRNNVFGAGMDEYKRVVNATLTTAAVVGIACYLTKFSLSRGFFVLTFVVGLPILLIGRYLLRRALHTARQRGALLQRVLIVGSSDHVDDIAVVLRRERWLGYDVVGALTPEYDLREETATGIPVIGNTDEAGSLISHSDVDVVFFANGSTSSSNQLRRLIWDLEHQDVQVVVAPSVTDISGDRIQVRPVGGLPLMHIDPPAAIDASRWGKRAFDVVGAAGLLLLFAPLLSVFALRIKLYDGGPILFRQTRVGRDGREFNCLKLRTMVTDAEALLPDLQAQTNFESGLFKMKEDPRVTKPGRWLRRFSLDELPQLLNVLRGDMSLIGPRPPLPREVAGYDFAATRRLRVRPGMTGLWQVSGRSDLSWSEAIRLDLYYVDNWSMVQDLAILARTLQAVVRSRGAY